MSTDRGRFQHRALSEAGKKMESPFISSFKPKTTSEQLEPVTLNSFARERLLGLAILSFVVACGALAIFLPFDSRIAAKGALEPVSGQAILPSSIQGVVESILPQGTLVKSGDTVAVVRAPDLSQRTPGGGLMRRENLELRLATAESRTASELKRLEIRQEEGRKKELALIERADSLSRELALREKQLVAHELQREKLDELASKRYISVLQMAQFEDRQIELRSAIESIKRARMDAASEAVSLAHSLREVEEEIAQVRATGAAEELEIEAQMIEQEASTRFVLIAPEDGYVSRRIARPGQYVSAGEDLIAISNADERLVAKVFIPSALSARLAVGNAAKVSLGPLEELGLQPLEAEVAEVSNIAVQLEGSGEVEQWHIEASLRLHPLQEGVERHLKADMPVTAEIITGRGSIWNEVLP